MSTRWSNMGSVWKSHSNRIHKAIFVFYSMREWKCGTNKERHKQKRKMILKICCVHYVLNANIFDFSIRIDNEGRKSKRAKKRMNSLFSITPPHWYTHTHIQQILGLYLAYAISVGVRPMLPFAQLLLCIFTTKREEETSRNGVTLYYVIYVGWELWLCYCCWHLSADTHSNIDMVCTCSLLSPLFALVAGCAHTPNTKIFLLNAKAERKNANRKKRVHAKRIV